MKKKMLCVLSLTLLLLFGASLNVFAGNLHGTITIKRSSIQYNGIYFDTHYDTSADSAAQIWLCPSKKNVAPSVSEESYWIMQVSEYPEKGLFCTKTDGYGRFEMYGIPEGEYWIWIRSADAKNYSDKSSKLEQEVISDCILSHKENYKSAELWMHGVSHVRYSLIKIKNGNNVFNHVFMVNNL